ncbi:hypothetical protein [Streptomyces tropicalis]|uniref:Lipoprotein n=1 Tax=Streptomyces tropicalis TaxID=3034234 RepID=A0ABT6A4R8_9ACTN|nr:hypothetical protein [Streptomyces tropicalis]MDF3299622.1 hypothetical protein [Streptomyces tropicalis]
MHRTTTTSTLLITVAVSALSGCVTVRQQPPAPGIRAAASGPSAPRPDGTAEPRAVQAPAREALERVGPQHPAQPTARTPAAATGTPERPAHRAGPDHPDAPPAPRHHHTPLPPHFRLPGSLHAGPGPAHPNADLCALGHRYGGWKADSPESRICRQAYGH